MSLIEAQPYAGKKKGVDSGIDGLIYFRSGAKTLAPPTHPMAKEADSAGFYALGERRYPRLQIITVEQALSGTKPAIPLVDAGAAFKRAARERVDTQARLDI